MLPHSEDEIRASFVNGTKGDVKRMRLPEAPPDWDSLLFLGWIDPKAPQRGHLVAEGDDGSLLGLLLRVPPPTASRKPRQCSVCVTAHAGDDVRLMVAPRPGSAGREGNTVGTYLCADLACSDYLRGRRRPSLPRTMHETLTVENKLARARENLWRFVDQVMT